MTKKQRKQMYLKIAEAFEKRGTFCNYICWEISSYITGDFMGIIDFETETPEFWLFKPINKDDNEPWFNSRSERATVLYLAAAMCD